MLLSIRVIPLTIGIHSLIPLGIMQIPILQGLKFSHSTIHRSCLEVIQMATVFTTHLRRNIQVVFTHQILSTVLTHKDLLQATILTRAVLESKAVGPLDIHILSTNITITLDRTVKGVQDILQELILTTVKVVTQCLLTLHILPASLFILAHRPRPGHTQVHMHLHSSSGLQVSSHHKIIIIIFVLRILQHGQGLALEHHLHINQRTNVHHQLHQNPNQHHLLILQVENLQK